MQFKGQLKIEHFRKGVKIGEYIFNNGVTNVGKNHALDVIFNGTTQITSWKMGLIDNAGYTALAGTDTMASHAGWSEFTTYDESSRPIWDPNPASGQLVSNTTLSVFTISGTGVLKGVFVTSDATKGGTAGILWATALYSSNIAVVDNDIIRNTYTVSVV